MKIISDAEFKTYYRIAREGVENGEPAPDIHKIKLEGRLILAKVYSSAFLDHLHDPEAKGFYFGQETTASATLELLQKAQAANPRYVVSPRVWVKQEADVIIWAVWTYICEATTPIEGCEIIDIQAKVQRPT